jgi:collagenase-like PrtC family protease
VQAALEVDWLEEVIVDFLEVQGLQEAVAAVRAAGKRVVVATPRVLKPEEDRMWRFYVKIGADALLVRSAGMVQQLLDLGGPHSVVPGVGVVPQLFGDFSLNVANELTARQLLRQCSLSRLAPTHDLNAHQLQELGAALGAPLSGALEVIIHQHLPIFHTEHCVFCRFLSDGNNYTDCGHPCETNAVHLRDERGSDHLVLADMGCRNTVFNAQAQSGAFYIPALLGAGYRTYRIELVDEPPGQVAALLNGYRDVLHGKRTAGDLWSQLRSMPDTNGKPQGVEAGSLKHTRAEANSRPQERETLKKTAAQSGKWSHKNLAPIKVER